MAEHIKLSVGDVSSNGQLTILDEDKLCYLVKSKSKGAEGIRTISKELLSEFVNYVERRPNATSKEARAALSGHSHIDKYEYGYDASLIMLAKMVLGIDKMIRTVKTDPIKATPKVKVPLGKYQQIFFGAPGTGKSHAIKRQTTGLKTYRTTFHPDTDYATFVGAYKPTTERIGNEARIVYKFVMQSFLQAYVAAWEEQANENPQPVILVIEEINRGNCAQIFGDIFQLLDRQDSGFSEYPIHADKDLQEALQEALKDLKLYNPEMIRDYFKDSDNIVEQLTEGQILILPDNLYIWATMNTSDQSLFTIDSAFKRRWDWQYVPITNTNEGWRIKVGAQFYDWWAFLHEINNRIDSITHSEDKKLGYFFCKAKDKVIATDTFVSKVIFYLWNDVFKDFSFEGATFKDVDDSILSFNKFYDVNENGETVVRKDKVEWFLGNLNLSPIVNVNELIEVESEQEQSTSGSKHKLLRAISFPDGERLTLDSRTHFGLYIDTLKKIGLDKVYPIINGSNYRRYKRPLMSKEPYPEIQDSTSFSYEHVGDYYLVKGVSDDSLIGLLRYINKELNLGLVIEAE